MHSAVLNCGFDESETSNFYEVLAGLLHLGNVRIHKLYIYIYIIYIYMIVREHVLKLVTHMSRMYCSACNKKNQRITIL